LFLILLAYVLVLYFVCAYRARVWIRGRKEVKALKDKARSSYIEQINGVRDVKLLNIKETITISEILLQSNKIETYPYTKKSPARIVSNRKTPPLFSGLVE
jgi:hypothetical protein